MRHHEQGFSHILIFLFFVIVLAAIGFAGWRVYQLGQQAQTNSNSSNALTATNAACQPSKTSNQAVATITMSVCEALAKSYVVHSTDTLTVSQPSDLATDFSISQIDELWWQFTGDSYGLAHQLTDSDSKLTVSFSFHTLNAADAPARAKLLSAVSSALTSHGLKKQPTPDVPEGNSSVLSYANDHILCQATDIAHYVVDPVSDDNLAVVCVSLSTLQTLSSQVRPIYTAVAPYYQKTNSNTELVFDSARIEDSKTSGYKISWGSIVVPE